MLFCMAYEVTATRRRPQTFESLVGQEFVVATLKNAIETGKIAHAYLFSGSRGCGKTSSARILARALNCEKGPNATPCGECNTCREIARGTSLDVIEIDGASNTSVNDVRQIKDEVLFPPNSSRYKIYIIDEVHMLSTSAFNALLKTIEEPPPYVIFIFATTELHKVPATIKSRCQQFNFRLVAPEVVKNLLADAAAEMNIKADDEALYWIARESTGSVRDAYTLFDQVAAFSGDHITYEKIRDKLGLASTDHLNELCELFIDGNSGTALEKLDSILQTGVSIDQFIINFADYLRNLLLIQSGVTKESLLGRSSSRFSQKVLANWDAIRLERALSMFLQLFRDVRYSLSPRFELELALSRLTYLSGYVSPFEVKKAVDSARNLLAAGAKMETPNIQELPQGGNRPLAQCGFSTTKPETAPVTAANTNPFEQIRRNITEVRPQQSFQQVQQMTQPVQQTLPQFQQPVQAEIQQNHVQNQPVNTFAAEQMETRKIEPAAQTNAAPHQNQMSYGNFSQPQKPAPQNRPNFQINMQEASLAFDQAGEEPPKSSNRQNMANSHAAPIQPAPAAPQTVPAAQNYNQQTLPQASGYETFHTNQNAQINVPQAQNVQNVQAVQYQAQAVQTEQRAQFVQQTQAVQNFGTALQNNQPDEPYFSQYEPSEDSEEIEEYQDDFDNSASALQSFDPSENRHEETSQPEQALSSDDFDAFLHEGIEQISSEKTLIGTALLNAVRWSFTGNKLTCFIEKPFLKNQIEPEIHYISSVFSKLKNSNVQFEVQLEKAASANDAAQEQVPKEVELLCHVFKGTQVS